MKTFMLIFLLASSPAWAQTQQVPAPKTQKSTAARVDPCTPIGKTAKGELVYSLKCESLPASAGGSEATAAGRAGVS